MSASVASSSSSKQQQRKEEDKEKKKKKSWSAFDDGAETQVTVRDSEGGGKEGVMSRKEKRRERRLANEPRSVSGEGLRGIHVIDFMEARATELSNMLKAVQSKGGSKRVFQRLPRHMRRRAMSHNLKRLPRRLREAARIEMEKQQDSGAQGAQDSSKKRPSRRQRRKVRNLREEYARRQRRHVWLETHLWHAKRMKMVNRWGYRLPEYANEKGVRWTYRSLTHGCLLSDISYYCCLEVEGDKGRIVSALVPLFPSQAGLTVKAKTYLTGQREGEAVLYRPNAYPRGAVGPVHFLWQAMPPDHAQLVEAGGAGEGEEKAVSMEIDSDGKLLSGHSMNTSKLWIFSHPSMYEEVLKEVQVAVESACLTVEPSSSGLSKPHTPPSSESAAAAVVVRSLKDELVRFRLIGPRSHALLMETLKPALDFSQLEPQPSPKHKDKECPPVEVNNNPPVEVNNNPPLEPKLLQEERQPPTQSAPKAALDSSSNIPRAPPSKMEDTPSLPLPPPPLSSSRRRRPFWWEGHGESRDHAVVLSRVLGGELLSSRQSLLSPACFAQGTVLGMTAFDPRLHTPSKKTDVVSPHYPSSNRNRNRKMMAEEVGMKVEVEEMVVKGLVGGDTWEGGEEERGEEEGEGSESNGEQVCVEEEEKEVVSMEAESSCCLPEDTQTLPGQLLQLEPTLAPPLPPSLPPFLSYSPIWDSAMRQASSDSRMPDHTLNALRSKQFSKSPELDLGGDACRVPLLLVSQSLLGSAPFSGGGKNGSGLGFGWDLILPKGWAMAFWVALVYRGARACGMRELERARIEVLAPSVPVDHPDTCAGMGHTLEQRGLMEEKHSLYPPDKRPNYGKLSIPTPFHCPWDELVDKWGKPCHFDQLLSSPQPLNSAIGSEKKQDSDPLELEMPAAKRVKLDEEVVTSTTTRKSPDSLSLPLPAQNSFYVLRCRKTLLMLARAFEKLNKCDTSSASHSSNVIISLHSILSSVGLDSDTLREHSCALVPVALEVVQRGKMEPLSSISLPTLSDIRELLSNWDKHSRGIAECQYAGPTEPLNPRGITLVLRGGGGGRSKCESQELGGGSMSSKSPVTVCVLIGASGLKKRELKGVRKEEGRGGRGRDDKDKQSDHSTENKTKKQGLEPKPSSDHASNTSSVTANSAVERYKLTPVVPSRDTIGYVTSGGHRLLTSQYGGVGFVSLAGLLKSVQLSLSLWVPLLSSPRVCRVRGSRILPLVLVRGANVQYSFARLRISSV